MSLTDANRPIRVFEKVLDGGLGKGNIGVVMSRHGTGKTALLTSLAVDNAMSGHHTLHICFGKSVDDVRAYDDEVLAEIIRCYGIDDKAAVMTTVERNKQIYTYQDGDFNRHRLRSTLEILDKHAEFRPEFVEIQGWPSFSRMNEEEIRALRAIAVEFNCEIWLSAHTHREDEVDERGMPLYLGPLENHIEVIVALDPEMEHVNIRFVKTRGKAAESAVNLEFDPKTMLLRWR